MGAITVTVVKKSNLASGRPRGDQRYGRAQCHSGGGGTAVMQQIVADGHAVKYKRLRRLVAAAACRRLDINGTAPGSCSGGENGEGGGEAYPRVVLCRGKCGGAKIRNSAI